MNRYTRTITLLLLTALAASAAAAPYSLLDVQSVPLWGDPSSAVVHPSVSGKVEEVSCDALVAGAGMGGISASLALAARGHSVCLTEETDWVGGQATAGGVSALDENRLFELSGGTRSLLRFRSVIRDLYRLDTVMTLTA